MQQWEYCQTGATRYEVEFFSKNGAITHKWPGTYTNFTNTVAALGEAGWELVYPWVFKRPMQPGRKIDDAF